MGGGLKAAAEGLSATPAAAVDMQAAAVRTMPLPTSREGMRRLRGLLRTPPTSRLLGGPSAILRDHSLDEYQANLRGALAQAAAGVDARARAWRWS